LSNKISDLAKEVVHDAEEKVSKVAHDATEKVAGVAHDAAVSVISIEKKLVSSLRHFLHMSASGGIVLVIASVLAIIIANSDLSSFYHYIFNEVHFRIGFADNAGGDFEVEESLLHWINDGLMALFFFLVGLEIKREVMEGGLSTRDRFLLPAFAAVGGMAIPALVFWFINRDNPAGIHGWAIPAATDIAFALAILGLLGSRAPTSLKILLTAIAVIDDLGAILIIAIFYSGTIQFIPLYFAAVALAGLFILNQRKVCELFPYVLLGLWLWLAVLESGIHATLAGVIVAMFIPMKCPTRPGYSPVKSMEHSLHPWIAFGVLPIFGFANAGVPFEGLSWSDVMDPVTLGIILGLFVGKQLGVFGLLWLCIVTGLSPKPQGTNWVQLYAVAVLCGVGFTMSLFIGGLAYEGIEMQASVRLGVIIGSVLSAALAYLLLFLSSAAKDVTVKADKSDSLPTLEDFK
jgi:NhaA family Na+:H+ antiporter